MQTPDPVSPAAKADRTSHVNGRDAIGVPDTPPPGDNPRAEMVEAVCEAEAIRRAKRHALLLMAASALLTIVLLAGMWLLLRPMLRSHAG